MWELYVTNVYNVYIKVSKEWDLYRKQEAECTEEEEKHEWPNCIQTNTYYKSSGIFLNLAAFGINNGCFNDDCSHSDHFNTENAGMCAEVSIMYSLKY